jgi:hypothetical protein
LLSSACSAAVGITTAAAAAVAVGGAFFMRLACAPLPAPPVAVVVAVVCVFASLSILDSIRSSTFAMAVVRRRASFPRCCFFAVCPCGDFELCARQTQRHAKQQRHIKKCCLSVGTIGL